MNPGALDVSSSSSVMSVAAENVVSDVLAALAPAVEVLLQRSSQDVAEAVGALLASTSISARAAAEASIAAALADERCATRAIVDAYAEDAARAQEGFDRCRAALDRSRGLACRATLLKATQRRAALAFGHWRAQCGVYAAATGTSAILAGAAEAAVQRAEGALRGATTSPRSALSLAQDAADAVAGLLQYTSGGVRAATVGGECLDLSAVGRGLDDTAGAISSPSLSPSAHRAGTREWRLEGGEDPTRELTFADEGAALETTTSSDSSLVPRLPLTLVPALPPAAAVRPSTAISRAKGADAWPATKGRGAAPGGSPRGVPSGHRFISPPAIKPRVPVQTPLSIALSLPQGAAGQAKAAGGVKVVRHAAFGP
jgi:hypothetical protein